MILGLLLRNSQAQAALIFFSAGALVAPGRCFDKIVRERFLKNGVVSCVAVRISVKACKNARKSAIQTQNWLISDPSNRLVMPMDKGS